VSDAQDQLKAENEKLRRSVASLTVEVAFLRQKLDALAKRYFGKKTEKLSPDQLQLLLSGLEQTQEEALEEAEEPPARPTRKRQRKTRMQIPDNLPVEDELIIPEEVKVEPQSWKEIGREVLEQLDYQPGRFFKRRIIRPKYVRRDLKHQAPIIVPAPAQLIERGMAAPGLLAQILTSKFCDHLPYYRQEQIFKSRYGVWIARQQMVRWTNQCVGWLEGIHKVMSQEMAQSSYLQVDETPVTYLDRDVNGGSAKGFLWTYLQPGVQVVYDWHSSRAATCLQSILGNSFSGKLQCDGYSAYQRFASDNPSAKLHGCWAHMRRKFYESQELHPRIVGWILRHIQQLYQWEDQLRTSRAGPNLRHSMRTSHHKLVCQRLFKAFENLSSRILPKSNLGKALNYALNQRESLERVLDAGEVELDNNLVENAIRPTAIGKKNWLFMGSKESGHCSAVVYTLVQSCRMIGVEPSAYLRDVLEHLPTLTNQEIGEWTPMKWALRNGLLKATSRAA